MSDWMGVLELGALVGIAGAVATAAACAALYPLLRPRLPRVSPEARARLLTAVSAAPVAVPALLVLLCLLPSLLNRVGLHGDHCPYHAEHAHLCVTHRPPALPIPWAASSLLGAAPLAAAVALGAVACARSRRVRRSLALGSSGALRDDVRLVASPLHLSVTAGVLRPQVFVSERFAAELPAELLDVVIEHERAHARRRDGLRKLAADALAAGHLPWLRRRLRADLSLACEQACDAEAARRVGDRLRVAETILAAERLLARCGGPRAACAFGGSTVPERVDLLLDEAPRAADRTPARAVLAALAAVALALGLADPVHHLAEHVLARLLR